MEVSAFPDLLGVHSARWVKGTDEQKVTALLQKLEKEADRQLTYRAVICYLEPNKQPKFFTGKLNGHAAFAAAGQAGFGYDPIMIPDGYNRTLSQLGQAEKNEISHRRQAIDKLAYFLRNRPE